MPAPSVDPNLSIAALRAHLAAVQACERCPRMHRPAVVGRPATHGILLIGQAPGDKEPTLQRPFAWTAGKTLFKWLHGALGWTEDEVRDRVYFAAVCRCFPGKRPTGGDRVPSPEEIATCRRWLDREFVLLRPRLVLLVGKLAIQQFYEVGALKDLIGRTLPLEYHGHRADCIPLPHPSGASTWHRTEPGKALLEAALQRVAAHPAVAAAEQATKLRL
ncbi:uracil-DNA glycosylase family protein [Synoicihabitans lomoniglobus]|uniref:Uracil-DNA glycosylase family protein n=1 Tax=Synoicihabitans lomoniglobus TaxID=2909285 RepID=A0AAF0CMZ0_9BACT|nr:uracil-DNA glycosylase [Opitutaceae bacterium LMO-M01]WED63740.1 uracil-DNA glycosylase family protein [Opitutaceae bacterium LMO-M01]